MQNGALGDITINSNALVQSGSLGFATLQTGVAGIANVGSNANVTVNVTANIGTPPTDAAYTLPDQWKARLISIVSRLAEMSG